MFLGFTVATDNFFYIISKARGCVKTYMSQVHRQLNIKHTFIFGKVGLWWLTHFFGTSPELTKRVEMT